MVAITSVPEKLIQLAGYKANFRLNVLKLTGPPHLLFGCPDGLSAANTAHSFMIYRDFNHWFSTSEVHGFNSASREFAKELWDDLEPTMKANLDDYMKAHLELASEQADRKSELVTAMLEYIEAHKQEGQKGFWRWWSDQVKNNS